MVIVMQFFAADNNPPRHDVATGIIGIIRFKFAVAKVVADAIDNARGKKRDPHHLHRPDRNADEAEEHEIDNHHDRYADHRMRRIDVLFHPVIGRAPAESLKRATIFRFNLVKVGTFPHDFSDAEDLRAVRIVQRLAARVVFAVHRGPFPGRHAGSHPQPETEEMAHQRVQIKRVVCRVPVQIDRNGGNSDVCQHQSDDNIAPPR